MTIAVLLRKHYYVVTMGGKGVFEIGDEYQRALKITIERVMKTRKTKPMNYDEIMKIKDREQRQAA